MIKDQIKTDLATALKNKDSDKINILRYILSKFQLQEINKQKPLTNEEEVEVLRKLFKELRETLEAAKKGNRPQTITQTEFELTVIKKYLPPELSDQELEKEIKKIIEKNQLVFEKNPKALIGICIKELRSKASTQKIIQILNSITRS